MKKLLALTLCLYFLFCVDTGKKLSTKTGKVSFSSLAEDHVNIKATSNTGICSIDDKNGEIDFSVTINDFKFDDEGMQELFSKQIMNSDQYPTARFKGNIADIKRMDLTKNGDYPADVKGSLTLHGVTKDLQIPCSLKVNGKAVRATAEFRVNMKDFKIENPIDNDTIRVTIDCLLEKIKIIQ